MNMGVELKLMLLCLFSQWYFAASKTRPHIIYILADDLGWNDVSFHGSPEIPTPNIDAMAASGVVLHNFYMAPQCTPSRGSLMTGRYPFNIGLQYFVIPHGSPVGLPLHFKILPQYLKKLGYSTNLIGKWHLGHFKKEYMPTNRGFDKFFGYLTGRIDHFDYTHYANRESKPLWGVDLHENLDVVMNVRGTYAADLFTHKAVDVIRDHNSSEPLFLFLSSPAPHLGNSYAPLQALCEDVASFQHIKNPNRRIYAGMVKRLDESLGCIFQALEKKNMLKNSIIVFSSDNGGQTDAWQYGKGQGSNWPLRGEKLHLWEGGVRVPAILWSPLLKLKKPVVYKHLMHVSDWLPTLYDAAGGDVNDLGKIDGMNFWPYLRSNHPSPRIDIPLNIDPVNSASAIRAYNYKLIEGNHPMRSDAWYAPPEDEDLLKNLTLDQWVFRNGSVVMEILKRAGWWLLEHDESWRKDLVINCGVQERKKHCVCDPMLKPCLFNIAKDPCEYNDISQYFPEIVRDLHELIESYSSGSLPPIIHPMDPKSDPSCHGFAIVSWQDERYQNNCSTFM